ncbi:MAG: ATP-binding cassette subfamily F protein uup [Candidatus Azotimanducaceae bacterium]|jgi:ATP-binding cassette subfamily F protein uup
MALVTLKDINLKLGDRQLLDSISFVIDEGQRVGLLGANGCGKSTLLRILAGELEPDAGVRTERRDLRLGYLSQEPQLPAEAQVHAAVLAGIEGRAEVLAELDAVHTAMAEDLNTAQLDKLLKQQQRLDEQLEKLGGHDVDHRASALLDSLGVPDHQAICGDLSGGERRRVAMARLLLSNPEVLLLDEPTNHLDAEVTEWLEGYLLDAGVPLVLVTHDRYFLDRLCTRIVDFDNSKLHEYDGGYSTYLIKRAERLESDAKSESARMNTLRRETEWIRRGPPARTTKSKARIGRHTALVDSAPPPSAADLEFMIPDGPRLGDYVLRIQDVSKSFGDRTIIEPFSFELGPGQRLGIVGKNGAGKTTLLRMIMGQLESDTGTVGIGPTVKFAGIDQKRSDLDESKTVIEEVANGNDYVFVGGRSQRIETFLEQFLFPGEMKHGLISGLSGGERNRVLIAKLLCAGGNVLVLDEPTNDLDLVSLRALEDALLAFPGAAIVVSHDRWFLDRIATRVVHMDGTGHARVHEGDLSLLLSRLKQESADRTAQAAAANQRAKAKAKQASGAPVPAAKTKRLSSRELKELAQLPQKIEVAETELADLDKKLGDPSLYEQQNSQRFDELTKRRKQLPGELAALYARWEKLEAIAEQA